LKVIHIFIHIDFLGQSSDKIKCSNNCRYQKLAVMFIYILNLVRYQILFPPKRT